MRNVDFTPYRHSTVGFDRLFDLLESSFPSQYNENFPPFDLSRSRWPASSPTRSTLPHGRITAELPRMNEKDIDRKSEQEDRERGWSERYYGRFERRLALPDGADEEHCEADFRDGVLTIRMPKTQEAARSRRIPINATTRH